MTRAEREGPRRLSHWIDDRSKGEAAYQWLISQLQRDLEICEVCQIVFNKRDVHLRHIDSGFHFTKLNLIDGTLGVLPFEKQKEDIAPYYSLKLYGGDDREFSDLRYSIDWRSRQIFNNLGIPKIPNLFPLELLR